MQSKVFISHSSADKAIADAICQRLESDGIKCWIAPRDIKPGSNWTEGIMEGIEACRTLILVFSEHANNSDHVYREVAKACSSRIAVIPFRVTAVVPSRNLSYFLDTVHWLEATERPLQRHLATLTERVKSLLTGENDPGGSGQEIPASIKSRDPPGMAGVASRKKTNWYARMAVAVACLVVIAALWLFIADRRKTTETDLERSATVIPARSVAVLPFESLSGNQSDSYFADGIQDEILNHLAKIAQLKVISRTSVMQYRADTKRDLRQIAIALGVANVLEGTVRRDGNQVRVSTELIDARNDNTIWADSYDRDLTNIFAIQSEIAQTVASRLSAQLSPEERKDIEEKPTNNLEAYDLYLQAKQLIPRENSGLVLAVTEVETFNKGIKLLEAATQKDPKFALAYCMMAKAHDFLYGDQIDHTSERRALGDAAVNEALRLRPDLAEVHLALALHLYTCYGDFERARVQIAIASKSLFNSPDLLELTAQIDRIQGRWEQATAGLEKAVSLDPRNPELLNGLAWTYCWVRRYQDAERIQDRLFELEPGQPLFQVYKAGYTFSEKAVLKPVLAAYDALPASMRDDIQITFGRVYSAMLDRDFKTAHQIVEKSPNEEIFFAGAIVPRRCTDIWLELVQGNHPTTEEYGATREQLYRKVETDPANPALLSALGCVDIALGSKQLAISEAKRAVEMLPISKDAVQGPNLMGNLARVYTWANEPDLALETLGPLTKIPSGVYYGDLKLDPSWGPLRQDPRFEKLLAELAPKD